MREIQVNGRWTWEVTKWHLQHVCYLTGEYFKIGERITLFFTNDGKIINIRDKYNLKNLECGNKWVKTKQVFIPVRTDVAGDFQRTGRNIIIGKVSKTMAVLIERGMVT